MENKNNPRNRVNGFFGGRDENQPSERLTRRDFCARLGRWSKAVAVAMLLTATRGLLPSNGLNDFQFQIARLRRNREQPLE